MEQSWVIFLTLGSAAPFQGFFYSKWKDSNTNNGGKTISAMTLRIMTLSVLTLSIMTLTKMTQSAHQYKGGILYK
jgi:hypothetical protein